MNTNLTSTSMSSRPAASRGNRGGLHHMAARLLAGYMRHKIHKTLTLSPAVQSGLPAPQQGHSYVLYVHVPFCESLCPYCSFNRFLYVEERARAYFRNLRKEMQIIAETGYRFPSMYIGGGTPTILIDELTQTIDLARQLFGVREVSCETNPNHLTDEVIDQLTGRVDRLSVGVQSFNDDLLRQMSRYQKFGSGNGILQRIQQVAGRLPALNIDMIFNFPGQTEAMLRDDIERVIASGAEQTTFYPLMSAPSVEIALQRSLGRVDYRREAAFYPIIVEALKPAYDPLSAWTFSKQGSGMLDEYIVEYGEYVGAGSGSFSYLDGQLYVNTFSLNTYEQKLNQGHMPLAAQRSFGRLEQMQYRFMMELFDLQLDKKRFQKMFGLPVELGLWKEMLFMTLLGSFEKGPSDILRLSPQSRYLLVVMMREFFSGVNVIRDQARKSLSASEQLMCLVNDKILT